jgi:hypothetical protein
MGIHKYPTLGINPFLSCNSIASALGKDGREEIFGMFLGNYCLVSCSITSLQPYLNS